MRVLLAVAVLLALSLPPATAQGTRHGTVQGMRHSVAQGVRIHHQLHQRLAFRGAHFRRTGRFDTFFPGDFGAFDPFETPVEVPVETGVPSASPVPPALHLPRHPGDDRATVEQTPFGVTVIRGPGSHHLAP